MKMNKLTFPLMVALAATLAATGCKKGPTRITQLPQSPQPIVGDNNNPNTLPNTQPYNVSNAQPINYNNNAPIPTDTNWVPGNMNQDRSTLAAYTVHFSLDSAAVRDSEKGNITAVAGVLSSDPTAKLLIEGNCDERGTEEYNRALGARRALALREALAAAGIDPKRIRTISYGKDKPVDPSHNEAAYAKNRRGDFVLCHPKGATTGTF